MSLPPRTSPATLHLAVRAEMGAVVDLGSGVSKEPLARTHLPVREPATAAALGGTAGTAAPDKKERPAVKEERGETLAEGASI